PVIEYLDAVKAGEAFEVKVSVGKEIAHPNTAEHHIRWISLYFQPEGDKFTYEVAHFEFNAHGEGTAFTSPMATASLKVDKPGTLHALSLCNLHGLWESSKEIGAS
ncbi:MAG: class II SORL domain-containing protein, partial [Chloroflexi bacterium]|nr:class II SORL domain-containing protein [Chloroflexota bacterium]